MGRAMLILNGPADRRKAAIWLEKAPAGTRVEFKASRRSLPQNARFWAMLSHIASQLEWHGVKLRADDWRLIFLDALKRELRMVPNLDGNGLVSLGRSSSDLSKQEMADCMELIAMFAAKHGIAFPWEEKKTDEHTP